MTWYTISMKRNWNKVFEIGSPKTGTTSLGQAFTILGLKTISYTPELYPAWRKGRYDSIIKVAEDFDAFEDGPWHDGDLYKVLDEAFPGSKFILLERDIEGWIESHEAHFSADGSPRTPEPIKNYQKKKDEIIKRHIEKYQKIKEYFKERPKDLLVMDICSGDGWDRLCPFLEISEPKQRFPHNNRTKDKGVFSKIISCIHPRSH